MSLRTKILLSVAALAAMVSQGRTDGIGRQMPRRAYDFVNSIGVNTHFGYYDTQYGLYEEVLRPRLLELGVKHIRDGTFNDDVARKYVVPPETVDLACLFVPSEAVYTQICADEPELVSYAAEKHVLITSPTTLVGVIFALVSATRDFDRARNIDEVVRRIGLLQDDVRRLNARLDAAAKALDTCQQRFSDVHVSGSKIVRDIEKLASGTLE